jgi:hypothetical protein
MVMPLRDMVCGLFNLTGYTYETLKDDPILPNHVTPREAIQHLDIHWARELFGEDFLGNLLVKELERNHRKSRRFEFKDQVNIHFVDAGVEPEFQALKTAFGDRVKVLRIYRNGTEFDDTREWLSQCNGIVYNNDDKVDAAVDQVMLFINGWLERLDDQVDAGDATGVLEASKSGELKS